MDLKDSSGRPRNRVGFTPDGAAVALTDRHDSLLRVELTTGVQRRIEVPDLLQFVMIGATGLVGVDLEYRPHLADFAAGVSSPLTPKLELGGSTRAQLRRAESGAVWTCGALGPGALIELAPVGDEEARARVRRLAAGL